MKPLLEVREVSKRFGGLQAVRNVSLSVGEGEIVGLIGPNGAGKSTLFNLIDGVEEPDSGRVMFLGDDITGLPPYRVARRGLSRTHQIVRPLNDLTVLANCTVGACYGHDNRLLASARSVAREVLQFTGLADRADVLAAHLTAAGKKRLELARALSARPRILLLDETLAGLNPAEVAHMIEIIKAIRGRGVSILMIEHLMQAIMGLSDRVLVLNFGELLAVGRPQEIANNPKVIEAYLGDPSFAERLIASR